MPGRLRLRVKRIYDPPDPSDGARVLVDRLWPRGVRKERARLKDWLKDVAPSHALRRWSGHDPARWDEFKQRYFAELDANTTAWRDLLERARKQRVTLLYAARDAVRNNAVALKLYLEQQDRRLRAKAPTRKAALRKRTE